jgi:hypothetical protein
VRRYTLTPQFLRDFRTLEPDMSLADIATVDALLAAVISNPQGVRRVQSFYDPQRPSWLSRASSFVVHYAYDVDVDEVTFLNIFRRS